MFVFIVSPHLNNVSKLTSLASLELLIISVKVNKAGITFLTLFHLFFFLLHIYSFYLNFNLIKSCPVINIILFSKYILQTAVTKIR